MKATISIFLLLLACCANVWAESPVYIDVRSAEEFAQGHIEGALLMPHGDIAERIAEADISKSTPLILYCRSGRRAEVAREKLLSLGYTSVTNAGGYQQLAADLNKDCQAETC